MLKRQPPTADGRKACRQGCGQRASRGQANHPRSLCHRRRSLRDVEIRTGQGEGHRRAHPRGVRLRRPPGDVLEHPDCLRGLPAQGRQVRVRSEDEPRLRRPCLGGRRADRRLAGHVPVRGPQCLGGERARGRRVQNAYNIVDGVEGDLVHDPDSVFVGKRMRNGWKNSAPWVYSIDPEKVILEEGTSKQTQ